MKELEIIEIPGNAILPSNPVDPSKKRRVLFYRDLLVKEDERRNEYDGYKRIH